MRRVARQKSATSNDSSCDAFDPDAEGIPGRGFHGPGVTGGEKEVASAPRQTPPSNPPYQFPGGVDHGGFFGDELSQNRRNGRVVRTSQQEV